MYVVISIIAIGLIKIVSSDTPSPSPSNTLCVYGAPMGNVNEGLQGEYKYGGKDSSGNDYWSMNIGTHCWAGDNINIFYIRYSTTWNRWEISFANQESCFYYECRPRDGTQALLPSDCGHNDWYGASGYKQDFYVINGECPPYKSEQYLDVTNYSGYWEACNGDFIAVDGKRNLYKRMENYDYGWGPLEHYWLYSITLQRWVCEHTTHLDAGEYPDYANGCYLWRRRNGFNLEFHD